MTETKPYINVNSRYSISQTAKLLGIHRNTLRNYTNRGAIRCYVRPLSYKKFYLGQDILKFWQSKL